MHAEPLSLVFRDHHGKQQSMQAIAIDLLTRQGEEWLIIRTDVGIEHSIRLDHIIHCQPE